MLYTILIFRDFIFKENALFTYFIVLFLYKTVKAAESILNSDDMVYPFLIFRLFVFVPHFVDVYVYAGTINRPLRLLTGCHFVGVYVSANTIKLCTNVHLQLAITQQHTQNAYFRIAKTILLQCKNPLFARQKPYFCTAKRGFLYNGIICKKM